MKDIYHDTIFVDKLIHYAGKRINGLKPLWWQLRKLRHQCSFLAEKDKSWFEERLEHATFEVLDVDNAKSLADANLAMSGQIEVVGGKVDVSGKIDWHTDFKNGYTWPKGLKYTRYQIIGPQGGRDVKTVWDLSRCHHLLWLASAYRLTQDENYSKRIVDTIDDWMTENPYSKSVNWVCPMDVAIRAVNWIFAVQMIVGSKNVDVLFLRRVFASLYQHATFIYANLEKSDPFSENHYASDITGLLFIGYLFDSEKQGEIWLDYALQSFLYEIRTQVLPSGVHFERSISYHRLMSELFLYSYLAIKKNTPNYISIDVTYRLRLMIGFIASYTKPSGLAPVMADNDNGRFLPFVKRDYRDHLYLIELAKEYGILEFPEVKDLFVDAGFAFPRNKQYMLSFTNTPTSRYSRPWRSGGIGTHTHLDALSIEISKGCKDFIVDAGAYTYTESKEVRKEFRSMTKHNTLSIDNDNPYLLSDDFGISCVKGLSYLEPEPISMKTTDGKIQISGNFTWKNKDSRHTREICMDENEVIVVDSIETHAMHDFYFRYHLGAGVEVSGISSSALSLKQGDETLDFHVETSESHSVNIEADTLSPSYGVLLDSKTIVVRIRANKGFLLKSIFQ